MTFDINGKCKVSFAPDDPVFAEKLFRTIDLLDKLQTQMGRKEGTTSGQLYELAADTERKMRNLIDEALGASVCDALFNRNAVYARAGGFPLWFNLMCGLLEKITVDVPNECREIIARYRAEQR